MDFISHARKPQAFKPGDEWHPFVAKRRPFPAYSGMVEGHARYARGLKPRSLDRGVGSFNLSEEVNPSACSGQALSAS